jgi:two-component system cell cycle sensor histidine kinase/response regulator CckA
MTAKAVMRALRALEPSSFRTARAQPPRILVVDDELSIRTFVVDVLRDDGYVTAAAADGPEALGIIEKDGPFDLLLTDILMPQMSGDELSRRVRHADPTVKVLYLTGSSDRLFQTTTTLGEGEAFLEKPCAVDELTEAVSLLLTGHVRQQA